MRIIIAGSRDIYSQEAWEILNQNPPPILVKCSEIVSGGARGVDTFAEELADVSCRLGDSRESSQ